jgi:hypothetical protein
LTLFREFLVEIALCRRSLKHHEFRVSDWQIGAGIVHGESRDFPRSGKPAPRIGPLPQRGEQEVKLFTTLSCQTRETGETEQEELQMAETLLTRKEAAELIQKTWGIPRTESSLKKLSSIGRGPNYQRRAGHVRYPLHDLLEWMETASSDYRRKPRTDGLLKLVKRDRPRRKTIEVAT